MNVGEANDANVVLEALVRLKALAGSAPPDRVLASAKRLADRANKALGAGLTAADIERQWK